MSIAYAREPKYAAAAAQLSINTIRALSSDAVEQAKFFLVFLRERVDGRALQRLRFVRRDGRERLTAAWAPQLPLIRLQLVAPDGPRLGAQAYAAGSLCCELINLIRRMVDEAKALAAQVGDV